MASTTLMLGSDGDLALSNGHLGVLADADAVLQQVSVRLKFMLGEWYLDETIGVPWLQRILQKGTPLAEVREHLRVAIASAPDVTGCTGSDLTLDRTTRIATVSYSATTTYGDAAEEVTV